jgi:DnaJ-class molecular chaperone
MRSEEVKMKKCDECNGTGKVECGECGGSHVLIV